ncbi:NAD(P)/FAD-dependent oxidoreductase [Commensalibacter oyaizuii]|uniref:FAD-dependent oxidoreductase n=1 Tax=Commensalibacter oyaizuii TaxID=3043873 RepID=A0ABT6Q5P5_9PROT|nr:FAD-dependent oxidoreductase [Commensalibacter sp. TBRC 16381]MDI2091784.1 FAD-dependent oxidoreductase [Commensalibacter sp. TBRC 16381]
MSVKQKIEKPEFIDDAAFVPSRNIEAQQDDWNWIKSDIGPENPANYYESTLLPWSGFPKLEQDIECDVVVIGGGLLGSSTALHFAEAGVDTVLLEKNRIGSAASGRNGGQLTPGLARWEAETMIENFDFDEACRLWRFTSVESFDLIDEIADRYGLSIDLRKGHLTAAIHPGHINALTKGADARKYLGDDTVRILGPYEIKDHINTDLYHGGALDTIGGQVHSLALTRGMVYGFVQKGGQVYEDSEVLALEETPQGTLVRTEQGTVLAKKAVVLAVHESTFKLLSEANSTIPFYTYVAVTHPITDGTEPLLPTNMAVYDTQFQIDYYRPVKKQRILFGGQGTGTRWDEQKTLDYLTTRLRTVFSHRDDIEFDFAWSGTTDLTLNGATDCRKTEGNVPTYVVQGWSGHGIAQTVRIGKAIRDDFLNYNDDFSMLTSIEHRSILLGRQLAPVAIPLAKSLLGMQNMLAPGKMISF